MKISVNKSSSGTTPSDDAITSDKGLLMDNIEIQINEDVRFVVHGDKQVVEYEENGKKIKIERLGDMIKVTKL